MTRRWWGSWRVSLRMAFREAWRAKGRSLLVLLIIALPVTAITLIDLNNRVNVESRTQTANALRQMGATANGVISALRGGPVLQGYAGPMSHTGSLPRPTKEQLLASLPADSQIAWWGTDVSSTLQHGEWGIAQTVTKQNLSDPLIAGLWYVRSGSLPTDPTQVALSRLTASQLHLNVGDTVTVEALARGQGITQSADFRVSGIADSTAGSAAVVLPSALPLAPGTGLGMYLALTPDDFTWADVRKVNAVGGFMLSRNVVENPPSFCPLNVICDDTHALTPPSPGDGATDPAISPETIAMAVVLVVLAIVQVALLAGPAFAVQLRRRRRELGLLAANGGDAKDLRRTMLASGVVLGLAGAVLGIAVGWLAMWLLTATRVIEVPYVLDPGLPPLRPELLALLVVGAIAAVAAALVPAIQAGRSDVLDALRGTQALKAPSRRLPLIGVVLAGLGLAGLAYGALVLDPVVLCLGILSGELGLILIMPTLVGLLSRLARKLPLSMRLAVRDAGRHRLRTVAAACAIAAAATGAVATGAWAQTVHLTVSSSNVAWVDGTVLVYVPKSRAVPDVVRVAKQTLPDSMVATMSNLAPSADRVPQQSFGWLCVLPGADPANGSSDVSCDRGESVVRSFSSQLALLDDPNALLAVLGPLAPIDAATAALREGKALVLAPNALDANGNVSLRATEINNQAEMVTGELVTMPAMEILGTATPATVIVGPAALAPGGALAGKTKSYDPEVVVRPSRPDSGDRPTAAEALNFAFIKDGIGYVQAITVKPADDSALFFAVAIAATVVLALLAGLMVTALALTDGRADLATLASVGASPGIRRRFAASSAWFVAALGCVVGAISGLLIARVLVPIFTRLDGGPFVMPWLVLGGVIVIVPILAAGLAWVTTRSRVIMVRRTS